MAKATKKRLFGVGINDANYITQVHEAFGCDRSGKQIQKLIWTCPFYRKWRNMLQRCYSEKFLIKNRTYEGCSTVPEWHYFMTFRAWMIEQDWEGKELDKDLLNFNNKIYGPETCVFVDPKVNSFMLSCGAAKGEWPIGVCFIKSKNKFMAQCSSPFGNDGKFLGYFNTPEEAHNAWLSRKTLQAHLLAAEQSDPRVAAALIDRYENYAKYFPQPT